MDIEYERLVYHKIITGFLRLLLYNSIFFYSIGSATTCVFFITIPNQYLLPVIIVVLLIGLFMSLIYIRILNKEWSLVKKLMREIDNIIDEKIDEDPDSSDSSNLILN